MALKEDALLGEFLANLQMVAQTSKPNFDADVDKYLKTFKIKIMRLPDSLLPKSNDHAEFSKAKQKIFMEMEDFFEQMEKDWFDHLASIKLEFSKKVKKFLQNTTLEVKLPRDLYCLDENSDSPNLVHRYFPGSSSQLRVYQESTHSCNLKPSTFQDTNGVLCRMTTEDMQHQTSINSSLNHSEHQGKDVVSNSMPSTSQDNSGALCQIKTENMQQQASRSPPLHYSKQLIRTIKGSNNEVTPHSPVNTLYTPCQSSASSMSNQSVTNWYHDVLNKPQSIVSAPSIELTSSSTHTTNNFLAMNSSIENVTDQNVYPVSLSITPPHIQPEVVSPKKKFGCKICKIIFDHKSVLKEHMRKHTNERPFNCEGCRKKFKTKGHLKTHLKCCRGLITE